MLVFAFSVVLLVCIVLLCQQCDTIVAARSSKVKKGKAKNRDSSYGSGRKHTHTFVQSPLTEEAEQTVSLSGESVAVADDVGGLERPEDSKSCRPPCRLCAPWEDSCVLPESYTPAEAKRKGIFHFVNPSTSEHVYRNRSYERNPFPYHPPSGDDDSGHMNWRIEYRISQLLLAVLRRAEEEEPQLRKIVAEYNKREGVEPLNFDEQRSVDWHAIEEQWESELREIRDNRDSDETALAGQLRASSHRATAVSAVASERFFVQQLAHFDVIFRSFIDLMHSLQTVRTEPENAGSPNPREGGPVPSDRCAVYLDDRASLSQTVAIRHTLRVLGSDWSLIVFHTDANEAAMFNATRGRRNNPNGIKVYFRRVQSLSWDKASALRASSAFYQALPSFCQKLLILEDDATIRRPIEGLEPMLALDVPAIGAPFRWCAEIWCRFGGNGGASLRSKEAMLHVYTRIRCDTDWSCDTVDVFRESEQISGTTFNTEDVFLAKQLYKHRAVYESRMPTFAQAQQFSVETMYHPNPVFVHKVWRYMHPINAIELLAAALALYPI